MAPRRSRGCGACIPELTTRRHRGRLLCFRQPSQSIHTSREAYTFRRRFRIPYVFSWAPPLFGTPHNTANLVVYTSIFWCSLLSLDDTWYVPEADFPSCAAHNNATSCSRLQKLSQLPLNSAKRLVQHDPRVTILHAACICCGGILSRCIHSPESD